MDNIISKIINKFRANEFLAKSNGETLEEHIKDLLCQLSIFIERYNDVLSEEEINILKFSILFHDLGKINNLFQKKLKDHKTDDIIPHNFLSPLFLKLVKDKFSDDELQLLTYAIINHHKRGLNYINNDRFGIQQLIETIESNQDKFFSNFSFKCETIQLYKNWISGAINKKKSHKYIIISGLLIRLDHAASGGLDVEDEPVKEDRKTLLIKYLQSKGKSTSLRPFQKKFGINQKKDYQCIVADTGLGKTGLSVLWSKRKKFYILPNRASVNAMYKTLCEIYGEDKVGLLHSTALFNLITQSENDDISIIKDYEQTRVLSKPVTVCTADQLFTAAFNMPGYEKIYATLAYSDVIIDEIQGFQPQQIIPILKQISETKELGTRYLIITATLPDIVAKKLKEMGFELVVDDYCTIDNIKRHNIRLEDKKIEDLADDMYCKYQQNKKVLVVTNTVKKSQEVYEKLKERFNGKAEDLHLLHSRFIWKHRQEKESAILKECEHDEQGNYKKSKGCVWVATQLVEASLDIDFDYLFTEASTADSLIQRMGRVWRHRKSDYTGKENVIIACDVEYRIYEEDLTKQSIEKIKQKLQDGYLLSEHKRQIVKEIYSEDNLKNSKYLTEWEKFENQLNSGWQFILNESSQRAFRDIMTVELIPAQYKGKVEKLVSNLETLNKNRSLGKEEKKYKRIEILKQIQEYKVPVPLYLVNLVVSRRIINTSKTIEWLDRRFDIGILNEKYEYDEEKGLTGKAIEIEESTDSNII